jgi:hypothetical protein
MRRGIVTLPLGGGAQAESLIPEHPGSESDRVDVRLGGSSPPAKFHRELGLAVVFATWNSSSGGSVSLSGQCRTVQRSPALERLRCGRRCAWQRRTLRHTRRPRGLHWHVSASCSLRLSCSAPSAVSLHAVSLDASSGRQGTWGHVARRGEGRQRLRACACMVLQFVVVARPPLLRCARERVVCMRMPVRV